MSALTALQEREAAYLASEREKAVRRLCECARAVLRDYDYNEYDADCVDNMERLRAALPWVEKP